MAISREEFVMAFDPIGFSAGMRAAQDRINLMHARLALLDATWEPIDWAEFD